MEEVTLNKRDNNLSYLKEINYHDVSKQQVTYCSSKDIIRKTAEKPVKGTYLAFIDKESEMQKKNYAYDNMKYDLEAAIAGNEFFLCYQPLVDAKTKKMVWMEALIRWKHPRKGIISPSDFIPIAEETGLIVPIGEWVLENACRQLREWYMKSNTGYGVSVNVSAIQLRQPGFSDFVGNILKEYGLMPENLEIEITESVLIESSHTVVSNLTQLSEQGIKITLDDFGTGYNSFGYIQKLLIDGIKIDRTFICNIKADINKIIIDTVISLGHKINAEVTAEGVETKEQYEYLQGKGCDKIQGYYFSQPLLPIDLMNYMKENGM